ncbi:uncharacterized protein LOC107271692 isoform X4 [Cephus cinctus]|uniref:Uncharacterized protein LOC107271692 isoform X4 n=1 Tax=Cephus cinctus TaxID=211228 RepID=A0AAJ7W4X2_CEPCN|nr:uncharacterized protein LOC107271692 isoform X4 [Cephus cinctus]
MLSIWLYSSRGTESLVTHVPTREYLSVPAAEVRMDEYDRKFAEMQKYIPFLEAMIKRLQKVKDRSREVQLQKMQSLHGILSNSKRKLRIETLQRCEDVLQKLHNKVEKFQGNTPELTIPSKKCDVTTVQAADSSDDVCMKKQQETEWSTKEAMDETPASPSPPASPNPTLRAAPIIIPTERKEEFSTNKLDSKPASPDQCETVSTKAPIIIPTERKEETTLDQQLHSNVSSSSGRSESNFSEWDMLEESEKNLKISRGPSWQSNPVTSQDVVTAAKLVGNSLPQKVGSECRPLTTIPGRHIPTVPVPSLGGSRRLSSVLEKNRLAGLSLDLGNEMRLESPPNLQDARLRSPDPDLFNKKNTSPRPKDAVAVTAAVTTAKISPKPVATTSLLVSPPPVLTEPPLSIEDLAELLNEEDVPKNDEKADNRKEKDEPRKGSVWERLGEEVSKMQKDTTKKETTKHQQQQQNVNINNKETRVPRRFLLSQEDIDRESERRWEEVDKHIVKLTSKKYLPNRSITPPLSGKLDNPKAGEQEAVTTSQRISQGTAPSTIVSTDKAADPRNRPPSPNCREREHEPRYADNYERHPRQSSVLSRLMEDELTNMAQTNLQGHTEIPSKSEERNPLYQRRCQSSISNEPSSSRDNPDYFNRQIGNIANRPPDHQSPARNDFCGPQWGPGGNFSGNINPSQPHIPNPYQRPPNVHPDMWQMPGVANPMPMEPHPMNDSQLRPQFPPNHVQTIRPMISPTQRTQEMNSGFSGNDVPNSNVPLIQPLMSPTNFSVGNQFRGYQGENRPPYDANYEMQQNYEMSNYEMTNYEIPNEFGSHVRPGWEAQPNNRPNEPMFRRDNEQPRNRPNTGSDGPRPSTPNPYARSSTPCSWNRDQNWSRRGRGRERYYNDSRARGEGRGGFNRDSRPEWENPNRFNRDGNRVSERDPRIRQEHPLQSAVPPRDANNSSTVRDPRLAKDIQSSTMKPKETNTNDRDPRRRNSESKDSSKLLPKTVKDKTKTQKFSEAKNKKDTEMDSRQTATNDKTSKDKMSSPLESLYGVIDTKAKAGPGSGLQKFKIPKIKRPDPPPVSILNEGKDDIEDEPEQWDDIIDENTGTDRNIVSPRQNGENDGTMKFTGEESSSYEKNKKGDKESLSLDANTNSGKEIFDISAKSTKGERESKDQSVLDCDGKISGELSKESGGSKLKEDVTQEWIEALIRKSLESGEGKKLLEQAKLLHKIGEVLQTKKLRRIKKIIESDSDSSSSDKEEVEVKKSQQKKKRRVIVSDSSEEESLADRLGMLITPEKTDGDDKLIKENSSVRDTAKEEDNTVGKLSSEKSEVFDEATKLTESKNQGDTDSVTKRRKAGRRKTKDAKKQDVEEDGSKGTDNKDSKEVEDKENSAKLPAKVKSKRRNSLEMLQEDIREMFISEGVVTATGHRMCRLIKEGQSNLNAAVENLPGLTIESKKLSPVGLSDKEVKNAKSSDSEGSKTLKLRGPKRMVKRANKTRSKEFVRSSGSEEDQPLAHRTENLYGSETMEPSQNDQVPSSEQNLQTPENAMQTEGDDSLRRSKRVLRKDILKEPRVLLEKADLSKFDSSKMMFDSSSDESFGIDVSELVAAVDISLHPEPQDHSEIPEGENDPKKRPQSVVSKRRKYVRKKNTMQVAPDKADDAASCTDEGSVVSDISLPSSTTTGKKTQKSKVNLLSDTNEELLSNILVGLVRPKSAVEKVSSAADKESDLEADEEPDDSLSIREASKKAVPRKKKKKLNWQMGILKKRKKKTQNVSSPVPESTESGSTGMSTDQPKDIETSEAITSVPSGTQAKAAADTVLQRTGTEKDNRAPKETSASNEHCESTNTTESQSQMTAIKLDTNFKVVIKEFKSEEETAMAQGGATAAVAEEENVVMDDEEADTKEQVVLNPVKKEDLSNVKTEDLINYTWSGQDRYKCLLCFFSGKNIVHHYKLNHSSAGALISRLIESEAKLAIEEAQERNFEENNVGFINRERCRFYCRFCHFSTDGASNIAMETFYEHCTTHTGEYRFRCVSCPYQAVAKSSMRTHYYKVCRKLSQTVAVAIIEDSIPDENSIYGYICLRCNFVQLKKSNIEKHMQDWHSAEPETKFIKINMSKDLTEGANNAEGTELLDSLKDSSKDYIEPKEMQVPEKTEVSAQNSNAETPSSAAAAKSVETGMHAASENFEITSNDGPELDRTMKQSEGRSSGQENENEAKVGDGQGDIDGPTVTGNLSAFVCPPELEHKEVEIQLERQKKMQEVIENIGIKVNKDGSKRGLSIIDKLKDKMATTSTDNQQVESSAVNIPHELTPVIVSTTSLSVATDTCLSDVTDYSQKEKESNVSVVDMVDNVGENTVEPTVSGTNSEHKFSQVLTVGDDDTQRNSSGSDTSDDETLGDSVLPYDSDSSSDQSDNELSTDVNTLLKETSNISTPSQDPMMTTIYRLAAQLKGGNSYQSGKEESAHDEESNSEGSSPKKDIPNPPNVIPLTSIRRFRGRQNELQEISDGMLDDTSQLKNFIRLRRLSGDTLSQPMTPMDNKDGSLSAVATVDAKASDNLKRDILQTNTDDTCSFLRIENVVSLAPTANNDGNEIIVSDIRKAMEISPVKCKSVSLLKRTNPLILKRNIRSAILCHSPSKAPSSTVTTISRDSVKIIPLKSSPSTSAIAISPPQVSSKFKPIAPAPQIAIQLDPTTLGLSVPLSQTVTAPATNPKTVTVTTTGTSPKINCKIVKVIHSPSLLKHIENGNQTVALKLKSTDAYKSMLDVTKLRHLYKCMSQECSFTTDHVDQFCRHYQEHEISADKKPGKTSYDYQNCAYCYKILKNVAHVKRHVLEKHSFCQFQCSYCFYRAAAQSYVEIHQSSCHKNKPISVLHCHNVKSKPPKDNIDRRDYVVPFVCQHECGMTFYIPENFESHLKNSHGSNLSIFKCHLCPATSLKSEQLFSHYKIHGVYKYQCLYCICGSDTTAELHSHLSKFHCNRIPVILERSFPDRWLTGTVDHLISINLEDNYSFSKLIKENTGQSEVLQASQSGIVKTVALPLDNVTSVASLETPKIAGSTIGLNQAESSTISKISNNLANSIESAKNVVSNQTDERQQNEKEQDIDKASRKSDSEIVNKNPKLISEPSSKIAKTLSFNTVSDALSVLKTKNTSVYCLIDKNADNTKEDSQHILQEPELLLKYVDEDMKNALENAVDPLEFSEGTNCNDEFVHINILDNPEFLKGLERRDSTQNAKERSKNEDSDIEILEDIVNTCSSKSNSGTITTGREERHERRPRKDVLEPKLEDPPIVCSSAENSNTSYDMSISSQSTPQKSNNEPLTLDDIRDTGFTGSDLYKCGYENCQFGAANPALLRTHLKECTSAPENRNLNCVHCHKHFLKIGFLLEHLKLHGLKRFGCGLCKMRYAMSYQAMAHMKAKHKHSNSKVVPADPKNPSVDGLFVIQPVLNRLNIAKGNGKKRATTKQAEKEVEKSVEIEKVSFSPDDIEFLPRQAIYNREVQCAVCPYTTKVRTNIIRHLQLHAKDETVPESGPVNPVPCLDKKERMFDKMVNLASSSHQNGRMGGKPKEAPKIDEDESMPKFVPEHKRYVCGVAECNYLTVDEAMLRYHLKALHSEEPYFRCPHCPPPVPGQESQNIAIDKMGIHLKMHDTRLYKCSHCNHHHYHRHVVERHLTDKHSEKRPFVKVIRELESNENYHLNQEETTQDVPDPDGNNWKCNICDFKCVYKAQMNTHVARNHNEKAQFKCNLCPYKTNAKVNFSQHASVKHTCEPKTCCTMTYQRIKGVPRKSTEGTVEQGSQDEPFDTTPLWRRDMPRVRHIRGILLEDENDTWTSESSSKPGKRKSDVDISTRPAKIRPGKSASLDGSKPSEDKPTRSASCEKRITDTEDTARISKTRNTVKSQISDEFVNHVEVSPKDNAKVQSSVSEEFSELSDSDMGQFGPYGKPLGNMFVCTLCNQFKSRYKHDMRDHLFRELKYARWHCKECGFLSVNRSILFRHFSKHHPGEQPAHEPLTPDNSIEDWVATVLNRQSTMMREAAVKERNSSSTASTSISAASTAIIPSIANANAITSVTITTDTMTTTSVTVTTSSAKVINVTSVTTSANIISSGTKTSNGSKNVSSVITNTKTGRVENNAEGTSSRPNSSMGLGIVSVKNLSAAQSTQKSTEKGSKTVNLAQAITSLRNNTMDFDMNIYNYDDDSKDNDDLVIDIKDDNLDDSVEDKSSSRQESSAPSTPSKNEEEKTFCCKHCNMKFTKMRGFKLHVQVTHLKRLGFLCPYCDRSTNSELMMRQHIHSRHPGQPEEINHNPAAGGPDLTNEFWEKEYGLVFPKKTAKKRKRRISVDESERRGEDREHSDTQDVCKVCGFNAVNFTGLKAHMRIHATRNTLKCAYCTFTASAKVEVWQHSEINHPHLPVKTEDIPLAGTSASSGQLQSQPKKTNIEDYSDDIEEEEIITATRVQQKVMYCCFYCTLRSSSLQTVKMHWNMVHKDPKPNDTSKWKTGLPFRYKQMDVPVRPAQKIFKCAYCPKTSTINNIMLHVRRKHDNMPIKFREVSDHATEGWVCQWCNEFCDSKNKMKHHHNMFHSHLPLRFKKHDMEELRKGYSCPRCNFTAVSVGAMKKHVAKHVHSYKCKHCNKTFSTTGNVVAHSTVSHVGMELKIENVVNYEQLVDELMEKVLRQDPESIETSTSETAAISQEDKLSEETERSSPTKNNSVAKKSTAKPAVRVHPIPCTIKSVARKSTNPLPRYPPGLKFITELASLETEDDSSDSTGASMDSSKLKQFSYYGASTSPVNMSQLSTYMVVGGHRMKVNCTTLAQLININPKVVIKDLKCD